MTSLLYALSQVLVEKVVGRVCALQVKVPKRLIELDSHFGGQSIIEANPGRLTYASLPIMSSQWYENAQRRSDEGAVVQL